MVLILGFALAASLGASALVLGEVKQTRIISDSVTAFFAADAGVEQALYQLCQQNNKSDQNDQPVGSAEYAYEITGGGSALKVVSTGSFRASRRAVEVSGFTEGAGAVDCGQATDGSSPSAAAQWKMDETAENQCGAGKDVCDSSGNDNHGDANGAAIATGGGIGGSNARSFDGIDDYVEIGDRALLDGSQYATWSVWFRDRDLAAYDELLGSWSSGNSHFAIRKTNSGTTAFFIFVALSTADAGGNYVTTPSLNYSANEWNQLAVVFDGTQTGNANRLKVYYDGLPLSVTFTGTINSSLTDPATASWQIGRYVAGSANPWSGRIDEVDILNTALSDIQICDNYKTQSGRTNCGPPPPASLWAQWKMDEATDDLCGSGYDACDTSGNNRHGTAVRTTIVSDGISGRARRFNGDLQSYVATATAMPAGPRGTVSAWVRPTSGLYYGTRQAVAGATPSFPPFFPTAHHLLYADASGMSCSGMVGGVVSDGTAAQFLCSGYAYNSVNFPINVWTHLALSYDGTNARFYKDGLLVGSTAQTVSGTGPDEFFAIGMAGNSLSDFFYGDIDEVEAYSADLTATQICDRYKAQSGRTSCLPPDTTPPAAVSNLTASSPTDSSLKLNWTASGDDGTTGTATSYDIRYSTSAITDANWGSATQASGEPAPLAAGSAQSMTVSGLSPSTLYYFAMKISDEVPNISGLSNVTSESTAGVINLIAQWKMEETSGSTVADTGAPPAENGTAYGAAIATGGGIGGSNARSFDGIDDYVNFGSSATLAPPNISVSFWTKNNVSPVLWDGILGKTNSAWNQGWGFFYNSAADIRFFIENYSTNVAFATINPLNWNHVVGTWDGTNIRIYINGVGGTADSYSGSLTTSNLFVMGMLESSSYNINGLIDEVYIYNTALSAIQICDLYKTQSGRTSCP